MQIGQVSVWEMQLSQKMLWQHGVSVASSIVSKQIGQLTKLIILLAAVGGPLSFEVLIAFSSFSISTGLPLSDNWSSAGFSLMSFSKAGKSLKVLMKSQFSEEVMLLTLQRFSLYPPWAPLISDLEVSPLIGEAKLTVKLGSLHLRDHPVMRSSYWTGSPHP